MIQAIVAVNRRLVLGDRGRIPWRCRADLRHFRRTTLGHAVLMGRKTWESLGSRPLDGRDCLVATRQVDYPLAGATRVAPAFDIRQLAVARPDRHLFVIGGGELLTATIDHWDQLWLSVVDDDHDGNVQLPAVVLDRRWRRIPLVGSATDRIDRDPRDRTATTALALEPGRGSDGIALTGRDHVIATCRVLDRDGGRI